MRVYILRVKYEYTLCKCKLAFSAKQPADVAGESEVCKANEPINDIVEPSEYAIKDSRADR